MSDAVLPRDCYQSYEVREMFGWRNARNEIVPISRSTLKRWRAAGRFQFVQLNSRIFLYTRASVDAALANLTPSNS